MISVLSSVLSYVSYIIVHFVCFVLTVCLFSKLFLYVDLYLNVVLLLICYSCFLSAWYCVRLLYSMFFFFFKQNTAYEWRISDWSSDVCFFRSRPQPPGVGLASDPGGLPAGHRRGLVRAAGHVVDAQRAAGAGPRRLRDDAHAAQPAGRPPDGRAGLDRRRDGAGAGD